LFKYHLKIALFPSRFAHFQPMFIKYPPRDLSHASVKLNTI